MDIGMGVVVAADIADLGYTARNEYHQCCIASFLRRYSASRNPSCRRASMNAIVLLPFRASEKSYGKENRYATSDFAVYCALSDEFLTDDALF